MVDHHMRHMSFIDDVAADDCNVLREKEGTYHGSWKRAGGRSAWFMARRNMDRLLTMMAAPAKPAFFSLENIDSTIEAIVKGKELPGNPEATAELLGYMRKKLVAEDIFAKILEKPMGEDGTVLACMRDLRRYLLLVEAEMMARQVVPPPFNRECLVHEEVSTWNGYETGRETRPPEPHKPEPVITINELDPNFTVVISEGLVHEVGKKTRRVTEADRELARPKPNPEEGSHHASLVPWQIDEAYRNVLIERVGLDTVNNFWRRITKDVYRLEPVVSSRLLPKELIKCYEFIVGIGSDWILRMSEVPEELRDSFPRLQEEMNEFEYADSIADYRAMYEKRNEKWVLRDTYQAWRRAA